MDTGRQTSLDINLGGEQVVLERVEATEGLSQQFLINVDLISEFAELDLLPHLGKPASVTCCQDNELQRYFHGLLVAGEFREESPDGFHFRLQLRPWTYFLSQNSDFAIFQDMDALAIIKQVLRDANISDVDYSRLERSCAKRTYCVQYGESDFAFISRLMEEEGIYYFFRHEEQKHVMVLCDGPNSHVNGNPDELVFNPMTLSVFNSDNAARAWDGADAYLQVWTKRVATSGQAKVTVRDFDFEKPDQPLEAVSQGREVHPRDSVEVYQYPGGYTDVGEGRKLGTVALNSFRTQREVYRGESQASGVACGTKLSVESHPCKAWNGTFMVTQTFHSITAERYRSGQGKAEESYNVAFEAIPAATMWQTPRITPKPIVHGLESAIVTGPSSEEIFTDEYGRVKVRFHWDRADTPGEKSTCWMRVSQTGGLGNIILPRVGHEVLIDFLGGDPDRPVVVGRVFNKSHMPIYPLPENKTRALWRTKTYGSQASYGEGKSLDTGAPLANELRFEDKGGEEEVFLHAERDMNIRVRHKETHHVGCDQEMLVRHDRKKTIENNETISVTHNRKADIGDNDQLDVGKTLKIKAGTTIEIEAGTSITLKCGGSTIKLDPTSIKIESTMINAKANATLDASSPMTTVKGTGILTLQGGLVKIN